MTEDELTKQMELRDKLIIRLLAETEPLCEECALKGVCTGAKFETCAAGLLAELNNKKNMGESQ